MQNKVSKKGAKISRRTKIWLSISTIVAVLFFVAGILIGMCFSGIKHKYQSYGYSSQNVRKAAAAEATITETADKRSTTVPGEENGVKNEENNTVKNEENNTVKNDEINTGKNDRENEGYTSEQNDDNWNLILVNRDNPVPENYRVELTKLSNGKEVDSRIYPSLQKMFDDMRNEGIYPVVAEGYRTHEYQQQLMDEKINSFIEEGYSESEAKKFAEGWVAVPGTSEHELGIAVDINSDDERGTSDEEVYDWLYENAYRYGFIMRYPYGVEESTGYNAEPWHYRYVGEKAAKEIFESGLILEEYLEIND